MEVRRIENAGETLVSLNGVHWIIRDFYDLPQEHNVRIESRFFSFDDGDWKMSVYPDGCTWDSEGWFVIEVIRKNSCYSLGSTMVRLGIAGRFQENVSSRAEFDGNRTFRCYKLIRRSILESRKDHLVPGGNLHLFFIKGHINDDSPNYMFPQVEATGGYRVIHIYAAGEMFNQKSEDDCIEPSAQTEEELGKGCNKKCDDGCIKSPAQTEEEIRKEYNQKCNDGFIEACTQTKEEIGIGKLKENFKEILLNGNVSDVVLKVQGQEFKCHRSILAARSPVFLAMMMHDTKEKATGVVDIQDVDPSIFPEFFNYLYTSSVESVTSKNAHKLYAASDIYQINDLKDICLDHMLNNISTDNFCDVFTLSLQHDEEDLKEACISFFAKMSLDIVKTCKWQTFLCENPIIGNELFIKHFQVNK